MTDLFASPTTLAEAVTTPVDNAIEALVGEGKKFKTAEDLAKAKLESDRFITQLQGELSGLRTELSTRQTLEQLMDKFGSQKVPDQTNQDHNQNSSGGDGQNVKTLTEADIARLVEERLTQTEKARLHQANLQTVQNALIESFGQDYVTHLKAKAQELGVSEDYLSTLAKETPKAFLKLVDAGATQKAPPQTSGLFSPPTSQQLPSTTSRNFAPTGERLKSYYDDLKSRNPTEYWSPKVQNQMHQDAIRLGEKFFNIP